MTGVILAAGAGSRFWPYAEVRNKCATPVCNKPAVRWTAEHLVRAGATRLVVVVGVGAQSVRHALFGLDAPVEFVEGRPADGAALAALRAIESLSDEAVTIAYGDIVTAPESFERTARAAAESGAVAVLAPPLPSDQCSRDHIGVEVNGDRAAGFWGHPRHDHGHVFGGLVAARADALKAYLEANPGLMRHVEVGGMPPTEADLAQSLQMMLEDGREIVAVTDDVAWIDLDKPWDILAANQAMLGILSEGLRESALADGASVDDSAEVTGPVVLAPGARIGKRCVVRGPVFLGEGSSITNGAMVQGPLHAGRGVRMRDYCQVGAGALGDDCVVGHGAEFEGVAFERVYFYHYCEIWGVCGACVDIGAATVCGTLRFDDGETVHRVKGRRETPHTGANASYLGDYSRTGVNAILMPGVKVGAYSCVGPGVVLSDDLPSRKACFVRQEHAITDWGPERYGW